MSAHVLLTVRILPVSSPRLKGSLTRSHAMMVGSSQYLTPVMLLFRWTMLRV